MRLRAPRSRALGRALAPGWRFIIAASGFASIEPAAGAAVDGLLWDIDPADRPALDRFEAVNERLYTHRVLEVVADGTARQAWAYIEAGGGYGTPAPEYLETIAAAARALGFPHDRIREIEGWGER